MMPQLRGEDIADAIRWIKEFIAQKKLSGDTVASETAPVGSIGQTQVWFSVLLPEGWVKLDGSLLFVTEAPDLYALIGNADGPPVPEGMFRLPTMPPLLGGAWIIRAK